MKMNIGRATSTQFDICAKMRCTMMPKMRQFLRKKVSTPNQSFRRMQPTAKITATPPSSHAIGKPVKIKVMNDPSIARTRNS